MSAPQLARRPLIVRRRPHGDVARAVERYAPEQRSLLAQHVRRTGEEINPDHALDVLLGAWLAAAAQREGD